MVSVYEYVAYRLDPCDVGKANEAIDFERRLEGMMDSRKRKMLYQSALGCTQGQIAVVHRVSRRTMCSLFREIAETL